jgi:hypothetical protein
MPLRLSLNPRWIHTLLLLSLSSSLVPHPSAQAQQNTTSAPATKVLNDYLLMLYNEAKTESLYRKAKTIIICYPDRLALYLDGKLQEEKPVLPPTYTFLKSVAHSGLGLFSLLQSLQNQETLSPTEREKLIHLRELLEKSRDEIKIQELTNRSKERQALIFSQALKTIELGLSQGLVSQEQVTAYSRSIAPAILANADEAAALQLAEHDRILSHWQLSPKKLKSLKVVIIAGHMPRQENLAFQYFSSLLKEKREGGQIIYCEGLRDEKSALTLLATHLIDEAVAVAFFKDKWRMHRDLLCDGAKKYLRKHPPLSMAQ